MSERTFNVLILCTGNSARSIIAEAVFNTMRDKRFQAYSAGSNPTGVVNPLAIEIAQSIGYPVENLRSKNWDEFAKPDSPSMDFIFTVCDKAAGQTCPVWPGLPMSAHWGFEDPAAFEGTEEQQRKYFFNIFQQIRNRIYAFASLPLATLDRNALQYELNKIGQQPVETEDA